VAIVDPYLGGKTTLLESLLYVTGVISRKGKVAEKNTVGVLPSKPAIAK